MITTGFKKLDQKIEGNGDGSLIVLAGRPAMGKTTLACSIARHVASECKRAVFYISLEMSRESLKSRLSYTDQNETPILISESDDFRISKIRQEIKLVKEKNDISLVIVDPIQLIRKWDDEPFERDLAWVTLELKSLAMEIQTPVIAVSQLSREVERQNTPRPNLSHLNHEGEIERDADIVLFLFREGYYNPTKENQEKAELLIGKNRCGPAGRVDLSYDPKLLQFEQSEI